MSSAKQNQHIARLIVGAMTIDGSLSKKEQEKVAKSLTNMGMQELIANVGAAIENDDGNFDMYQECRDLMETLGNDAKELSPLMFRMICDVIAHDRFVSAQEATYLSAVAKRLEISFKQARAIFKQVLAENRSRLEVSGEDVDELINPGLKDFLTFDGAEELVGELPEDSIEELLHNAQETLAQDSPISKEEVERALAVLGLDRTSNIESAEEVWRETIDTLNLPKMANLGETYVTAAISRITRINDAYKTILHFHQHLDAQDQAKYEAQQLKKQIERSKQPSARDALAPDLENEMTGVGTGLQPEEESS